MTPPSSSKSPNDKNSTIDLPFNQRIAYRQARTVVFLALIIGSIISGAQVAVDYFSKQEALNDTLTNIVQTSTQSASEALWTVNSRLAEGVIDGLFAYPPINSAKITSDANFDLAHRTRPVQTKQYQWLAEKLFGKQTTHNIELIAQSNGRRLGEMLITVDPHDEAIAFFKRSVVVFLFGIVRNFCLASILFFAFYLTLTRPLFKVASFINNQDQDKPGTDRINPDELKNKGELKVIAESLNNLLDNLGSRWQELAKTKEALDESNVILEQRVKERTSELRHANSLLISEKERADQASKAKSEFLANMSHEIRTPLSAVMGMIHLTRETLLNVQQQQYLDKAEAASKNLLHIINEILDFSKIEAGKLSLENAEFNLNTVFENLANIMNASASNKKLDMYFDYFNQVPIILHGDALRLTQVLINLASNAIKFTSKGYIAVIAQQLSCSNEYCTLKFTIEDSGIGMNDEQLSGIFDAFSQADSSTTRKFGGTGLGLAISTRLVSLMGGNIEVTSKPGEGSTFCFTACFDIETQRSEPTQLTELKNKSVILLDDYTNSFRTLRQMLEYHEIFVLSGTAAEKILHPQSNMSTTKIDCIFIDQDKADLNFIRQLKEYRKTFSAEHEPKTVLLASRHNDLSDLISQLNPSHVMTKPFTGATVQQTLRVLFNIIDPNEASKNSNSCLKPDLSGKRILVVEDDEVNQLIANEILSNIGVQVSIANNGLEAVNLLKEQQLTNKPFDLVLMDVQMPIMDGYDATKKIRECESINSTPIIAMTASVLSEDIQKCIDAGMNGHVSKPVILEELFSTLQEWTSDK